jgi:hypothetical protein
MVVALIVGCDLFSRKAARGPAIPVDGEFAEGRLASTEQLLIWISDFHFHWASQRIARGSGPIKPVALQYQGAVCSRLHFCGRMAHWNNRSIQRCANDDAAQKATDNRSAACKQFGSLRNSTETSARLRR